jgi:hypothetical protein
MTTSQRTIRAVRQCRYQPRATVPRPLGVPGSGLERDCLARVPLCSLKVAATWPRAIGSKPTLECMSDWRTVSIKLNDDRIAALNLRLKQLGFESMGDYARALTEGVVGNRQLVDDLAEAIAEKMVVILTTSPLGKERNLGNDERRRRDLNSQALSSGSFPGCWVTRLPIRRPGLVARRFSVFRLCV